MDIGMYVTPAETTPAGFLYGVRLLPRLTPSENGRSKITTSWAALGVAVLGHRVAGRPYDTDTDPADAPDRIAGAMSIARP